MRGAFGLLGATHYFCVNPDGYLHPEALVELLRFSRGLRMPALIEALQVPGEHPKEYDGASLETNWNTAGCLLIPKFLYELTGGFDERFFMYCEDVDLSWRVWGLGYRCLVAPRALYHHRLASRVHSPCVDRWFLESGRLLAEKWNCRRFRLLCEHYLVDRGHHVSIAALPPIPPGPTHTPHRRVDFGNMFTFARPRW
jgi:GT2 family glycosyltransferase